MNDSKPLKKIVCFGDSLTLGYQSPSLQCPMVESIPYGTYLQEWIRDKATVIVQGVCGETTQDMRLRFPREVLTPQPHVVIILGGTNDLSVGIPVAEIIKNLHFFYEQVQLKAMLPVAVTVPSVCEEGWKTVGTREGASRGGLHPVLQQAIELRIELNESIKELSKERRFPVVDWFSATCDSKTQTLAPEYSNDGLHLTTAGYRKLAEMIWDQVFEEWSQ